MDEAALIKKCILDIFSDQGYTESTRMTQRDFEHIGEEIEKRSGILISGTTIKRLSNGEFLRLPQVATLNAIANYFGFRTWQDFKSHKKPSEVESEAMSKPVATTGSSKHRSKLAWIFVVIPAVFIIMSLIYLRTIKKKGVQHGEKARFSFHKTTNNRIPNSVVFNYNIDSVEADSFFIQQSWDSNRRIRISKNTYTATDIYYEPGYHVAKLIANDSAIRELDISIPTDSWFFHAIDNVPKYTPEYINPGTYITDSKLALTVEQLKTAGIDISKEKRYHYLYFPSVLEVPSDNFLYKTRVRMKPVRNSLCPYIEIELYCQRSFMLMRSTKSGCAHEAFIQFGEKKIPGNAADLSKISFDPEQWTDVEIRVQNKLATVKINSKEVFSTQFKTETKLLTGLGFISNGLCEVDGVEVIGLDQKVMYKNEF